MRTHRFPSGRGQEGHIVRATSILRALLKPRLITGPGPRPAHRPFSRWLFPVSPGRTAELSGDPRASNPKGDRGGTEPTDPSDVSRPLGPLRHEGYEDEDEKEERREGRGKRSDRRKVPGGAARGAASASSEGSPPPQGRPARAQQRGRGTGGGGEGKRCGGRRHFGPSPQTEAPPQPSDEGRRRDV